MSSSVPVDALLNRVLRLNDIAIELWVRNDLVGTEHHLARALNCLHELCHAQLGADVKPSSSIAKNTKTPLHDDTSLLLCTTVTVVGESTPIDVFGRAFLLNSKGRWTLDSLDVIAAIIFYHTALFYHLQEEGPIVLSDKDRYGFVVRYYEKADRLLSRYLETTKRPLWLLQAAIWHNIGKCYQHRAICDSPLASYVYTEQVMTIVDWVEDPMDRALFKNAGVLQLPEQLCPNARAA
jgi:hypothetical protein